MIRIPILRDVVSFLAHTQRGTLRRHNREVRAWRSDLESARELRAAGFSDSGHQAMAREHKQEVVVLAHSARSGRGYRA